MIRTLVEAIENPPKGIRVMGVTEIRNEKAEAD
jgi:hypothetical protein